MRYTDVVWDFNGTLMDDVGISILTVNDMLSKRDMPITDRKEYFEKIEMPIIRYYEKMFDFNVTSLSELTREFQAGYDSYLDTASLAENAEEVLEKFKNAGINQVIISSFPTEKIKNICEKRGILHYFSNILGAEDIKAESKVERGVAFAKSRGKDAKIVAIGDLLHDYEMASVMGADCILYSGGHQSKEDLSKCGVPVADSMKDIERMILK